MTWHYRHICAGRPIARAPEETLRELLSRGLHSLVWISCKVTLTAQGISRLQPYSHPTYHLPNSQIPVLTAGEKLIGTCWMASSSSITVSLLISIVDKLYKTLYNMEI